MRRRLQSLDKARPFFSVLCIAVAALLPRYALGLQRPSLAGHWIGDVPLGEDQTPQLVLDLDKLGSRWVGEFDVVAFGVENYPVQVDLSGTTVKLRFSAANADFAGALSPDGDRLTGTLDFSGRKVAVEFQRTGAVEFSQSFLALEAAADDSTSVERLSANFDELRTRFNAERDKFRLVMLLSPT